MTAQFDDDGSIDGEYRDHTFNPILAKNFGINAALIFQYIATRSAHSKAPDKFVRLTLPDFKMQYPYMGEWEIRSAIKKLTMPASRPSSTNHGKSAPAIVHQRVESDGYSYAPSCHDLMGATKHKFDKLLATQIGVIPAIIYSNVSYWIKYNWDVAFNEVYQKVDPASFDDDDHSVRVFAANYTKPKAAHHGTVKAWLKLHPYITLSTAERGFRQLVETGLLKVTHTTRKIPVWELALKDELDYMRILLGVNDLSSAEAPSSKQLNFNSTDIPSKSQSHLQNHSLTFKITSKQHLNSEVIRLYTALNEAVLKAGSVAFGSVDEASSRDMSSSLSAAEVSSASPSQPSTSQRDEDAAAAPTLTLPAEFQMSRSQLRDAIEAVNPETVSKIRHLNRAHVPKLKRKLVRDAFGLPAVRVKRQYTRHPTPDDPDYFEYMEDLTPAERSAYIAKFSKKTCVG